MGVICHSPYPQSVNADNSKTVCDYKSRSYDISSDIQYLFCIVFSFHITNRVGEQHSVLQSSIKARVCKETQTTQQDNSNYANNIDYANVHALSFCKIFSLLLVLGKSKGSETTSFDQKKFNSATFQASKTQLGIGGLFSTVLATIQP